MKQTAALFRKIPSSDKVKLAAGLLEDTFFSNGLQSEGSGHSLVQGRMRVTIFGSCKYIA